MPGLHSPYPRKITHSIAHSQAVCLVAQVRAKAKQPVFRVEGHTDAKGAEQYNQELSVRRATSVRDWLVRSAGLRAGSVTAVGFGETRPVAPNAKADGSDDPEGRQRNRRVEIVVSTSRP
jgi:outer membrane protein OmpA-like peptidoglycan-associated protein